MISVIIATYNSGNYLQGCIDSVISQTYNGYEIIIIDGGSSDNTCEIINQNRNFLSYTISEPDNGIYDAWNKGIQHSSGEWVMFIGSDDLLNENALQIYANFLSHNDDYEYISSCVEFVKENLQPIKISGDAWEWNKFRRYMNVIHAGSIHKRIFFDKYGLFATEYKIAGDYELLLRAGRSLHAGFINKVTLRMRIGGVSNSNSNSLIEARKAKIETGKLMVALAYWDYLIAFIKFKIKKLF